MRISALNIFPMKSARGIALEESPIDAMGLAGDRRWMLTDETGYFITQRDMPKLARLIALPTQSGLTLGLDEERLDIAIPSPDRRMEVVIWKSSVSAALADDRVNARLSHWLEREVRLVFFDDRARRVASPEWAGSEAPVAFGDGYQVLVTTTGSLAALNADMAAHGEETVGMDRFRANIVLEHDEAWAEDGWSAIAIGDVVLDLVKPCARCIMTTQDQQTGSREGASPMPAMGRIRMSGDRRVPGPLFGWNAVPRSSGHLKLGDRARVIDTREAWSIKRR
ncbi:MOSC domain-containing protein [Rhizobium sp. SSA_523]|uniref:MOSC domain-containing protein n=1 Tax=Rhizobium sp. SSA_523 TaxID=2952477 RepID=UPI00209057AA|nr:MOSC domain-containing protein [Rhizobium sp. SSA_523]MCO5730824.1 MOSC domain-containing protein [Rhizobium sp. SSA_523]WKC24354.1 MOSC domain-containing protein [Rhizobium sp. SSA_523]